MVRMAQDFSLRAPLVDGHGNFGSLDGDAAAAIPLHRGAPAAARDRAPLRARQEDRRLAPELRRRPLRADRPAGALPEPPRQRRDGHRGRHGDVDPAAQPRRGHRRRDRARSTSRELERRCKHIKGPDFPTGGQLVDASASCAPIYETRPGLAQAARRVEGRGGASAARRRSSITSIPYAQEKAALVEKIADVIIERKLPSSSTCATSRTDDVAHRARAQEGRRPRARDGVPLQAHAARRRRCRSNLTCLVPTANPDVCEPGAARSRRDPPALPRLPPRDRAAEVRVRPRGAASGASTSSKASSSSSTRSTRRSASSGSPTARRTPRKLMKRFELDEEQVEAILEREALQARAARDRRDPRGAEGEASRGGDHRGDPQVAKKLWNEREGRARRGPRDARGREAPDEGVRERRGADVRRRGVHPATRTRSSSCPSTAGSSAQRETEGSEVHAPARRRRRARRPAGLDEGCGVLSRTQARRTCCGSTTCRPRRATGEPVQKLFKFGDGERVVAALSLRPASRAEEPDPPRRHAPRPRPPVLARSVPRGDDARRPPRSRKPAKGDETRRSSSATRRTSWLSPPRRARDPARRRGPRPRGAGQGRSRLQARAGRPPRRRGPVRRRREARDPHARGPSSLIHTI